MWESRPAAFLRHLSSGSGQLHDGFELLGDGALQPAGAHGELAVTCLQEERVDAAAMLDRAERMRSDSQVNLLPERVADQRHLTEIGQEAPTCLVVRVADAVARLDR